jgi:hypothetical protein
MTSRDVACNNCGWIHFEVSAEYVREWANNWIEHFRTKPKEWLAAFGITGKPPMPDHYYRCFRCRGSYKNFRDARNGETPTGSTTQPIMARNEEPV